MHQLKVLVDALIFIALSVIRTFASFAQVLDQWMEVPFITTTSIQIIAATDVTIGPKHSLMDFAKIAAINNKFYLLVYKNSKFFISKLNFLLILLLKCAMSTSDSDIKVGECSTCGGAKVAKFCVNRDCQEYTDYDDRLDKQQQQQLSRQKKFDALLAQISATDAEIYCKYMQEKIAQ
jgi:hypothetical protein